MITICSLPLPFGSSNYSLREEETLVVFLHGSVELWFYPLVAAMAAVTEESLGNMLKQILAQQSSAADDATKLITAAAEAAAEKARISQEASTEKAMMMQNELNMKLIDRMMTTIETANTNNKNAAEAAAAEAKAEKEAASETQKAKKDEKPTKPSEQRIDPRSFNRIIFTALAVNKPYSLH